MAAQQEKTLPMETNEKVPAASIIQMSAREKLRDDAFCYLFLIIQAISEKDQVSWENKVHDIDFGRQMEGAVSTINNILRKRANDRKSLTHDLEIRTIQVGIGTTSIKEVLSHQSLWDIEQRVCYKEINPIVTMLTINKLVNDEARMGCTQLSIDNVTKKSITAYGLSTRHVPLLKYISFKPERRKGLSRALGPLTMAIHMIRDKKLIAKNILILQELIQHIQIASEVAECIAVSGEGTINHVLKELGDLLLLTTDRTANKASFPLLIVIHSWHNHKNKVIQMDFSGIGAFKFYDTFIADQEFTQVSDGTEGMCKESLFHSIFSTYLEDFGVLTQITNYSCWHKRSDISFVFTKTKKATMTFKAIKMVYASKLASACMTKMIGAATPMLCERSIFSGKRKRIISDELLATIKKGSGNSATDTTPSSISAALSNMRLAITKDNVPVKAGTTKWHKVADITWNSWGNDLSMVVNGNGNYFF